MLYKSKVKMTRQFQCYKLVWNNNRETILLNNLAIALEKSVKIPEGSQIIGLVELWKNQMNKDKVLANMTYQKDRIQSINY
jgi:hypothetical protein